MKKITQLIVLAFFSTAIMASIYAAGPRRAPQQNGQTKITCPAYSSANAGCSAKAKKSCGSKCNKPRCSVKAKKSCGSKCSKPCCADKAECPKNTKRAKCEKASKCSKKG